MVDLSILLQEVEDQAEISGPSKFNTQCLLKKGFPRFIIKIIQSSYISFKYFNYEESWHIFGPK